MMILKSINTKKLLTLKLNNLLYFFFITLLTGGCGFEAVNGRFSNEQKTLSGPDESESVE